MKTSIPITPRPSHRRRFIRTSSGLLAAILCALGGSSAAVEARPNVLFLVIDNADYRHFGRCYDGAGLTPHLDRIAERGVKFSRAYATTPLCVPSRYTCLTGRYASRAREAQPGDPADDEEAGGHIALEKNLPNLPKVMREAGYATGFVGKYHLEAEKYPRFTGEDVSVFDPRADAWLHERNAWLSARIKERGFDFVFHAQDFRAAQFGGIDFEGAGHNLEADVLGALRFIEQSRDKPFFLYLATRLIHLPIDSKLLLKDYAKFGRVTEGGLLPEAPRVPMPARREIYERAKQDGAKTSQQFGMAWLDTGIGAILTRLEELALLDNTLVVLFSDNNMRGKETLYEGGARVPLLMMWPRRLAAGAVCDRLVANTDFAPTIFDACGITPPAGMKLDGRSLLPILADARAPWRDALLLENGHTRAVVTEGWKYVALRYPPDVQAKIAEVDRTGQFPRLTRKAGSFFEKFKKTLTPEQWQFARNSWRWHTQGNNYMKSIDDFPFQFDPDQLFEINHGLEPQDTKNVAADPANAAVLAEMKTKLQQVLAPLEASFGEFGTALAADKPAPVKNRKNKKP